MDIIEMTRELARAIQADDRYTAYNTAIKASDEDENLQNMIGEFNLTRMAINNEIVKGANKDQTKIDEYNTKIEKLYSDIMGEPKMMVFNATKQDMDLLYKQITTILSGAINGEDPDTIDISEAACTGNCATCGGSCH